MSDSMTAERHLRESGLRLTPQRRALISVLDGNTTHPTADEVAQAVQLITPGVSTSTVYKALHEFAELGLLRELDTSGAMRFDPDTSEHAHLTCRQCGSVVDVQVPATALASIRASAPGTGVTVDVMLHGTCSTCTNTATAVEEPRR
jgi:Fur family peroxide stress response transcriptional regulator